MLNDSGPARCRLSAEALGEARQELALALAAEDVANRGAAKAQDDIDRRVAAATSLSATDDDVEMLGAWLPAANRRAIVANAAAERARAETGRCRAVLAAAWVSAKLAGHLPAEAAGAEQRLNGAVER